MALAIPKPDHAWSHWILGLTPRVTRLEHSVGAFILVRRVGATIEEQATALLHDISHTTLRSYHEIHKTRYLETTRLPDIFTRYGINYAPGDAVIFGKLSMEDARRIVGSLKAFPSATATRRLLVLGNPNLALILSRAYITTDKDAWSSPAHIDMYQRTGQIIREQVEAGSVDDKLLWQVSDAEFWTLLCQAASPEWLIPESNGLRLPHYTKIRTLDPDTWQGGEKQPASLSIVLPTWDSERQQYILSRSQH
ncbi:uncharacterized protein BDW70DRAFT_154339 [Aspergillus foveolatus]|uniref:uncharacterized protein n=1 Tax=Aspergillus foveolatus TaxID=210207 RepID=UPI003CCDA41B